jgi:flagellum-specific ATP synthase
MISLGDLAKEIEVVRDHVIYGTVSVVRGGLIEVSGITGRLAIGWRCRVVARDGREIECEVVGFEEGKVLLMAFDPIQGVGDGCRAFIDRRSGVLNPAESWLGRVVDPLGRPVDGKGPLSIGDRSCSLYSPPPAAHSRRRVGAKIDLGVRALNTFVTCCRGQRLGIFAGSGVGKSTLMSMLARYTASDVNVIGLVGERGRELQEFIEDDLGPDGMARTVVVVATSDQSPLMRRQAAYVTLTVAEYFRDRGNQVMCMIDSITRFAMAQREIGLAAGEPPTSKGYPPTVFAELPRLLERAGPGDNRPGVGDITGLFTVLVDGDDHNEPIADAVRGILDGHIVMERAIGERGRYPAINILRSVSRTMPRCNSEEETALVRRAVRLMSTYEDMAEMIRLGAYKAGSNIEVDEAIHYHQPLEEFLTQRKDRPDSLGQCYAKLAEILGMPAP